MRSRLPLAIVGVILALVVIVAGALRLHPFGPASPPPTIVPTPTDGLISTMPPEPSPTAVGAPSVTYGTILQRVRERGDGRLRCGINASRRGFSEPANAQGEVELHDVPAFTSFEQLDQQPFMFGNFAGFEADFCKLIATAIFSDTLLDPSTDTITDIAELRMLVEKQVAQRVEFVPLVTLPEQGATPENERFSAVVSGQVDIAFRTTTWTARRDTNLQSERNGYPANRVDFGPVIYHDALRFILRPEGDEPPTLANLANKVVCVAQGTTHADTIQTLPITSTYTPKSIPSSRLAAIAESWTGPADGWELDDCEALGFDTAQIYTQYRVALENGFMITSDIPPSREPLAPIFQEGDAQWREIVSYAIYAVFYADELGVGQADVVNELAAPRDPRLLRLLGREGSLGEDLGLDNAFAYRIIRNFGNYDEIYRRHLWVPLGLDALQAQYPDESEAQLTPEQVEQLTPEQKLARADLNGRIGPNRSWRRGGNLIAPPF